MAVPLGRIDGPLSLIDEVTHRFCWHALAAYRGERLDIFFPERGESIAQAKALCEARPVREQCLDVALADSSLRGIWGGVSERGRVRLRRGMVA